MEHESTQKVLKSSGDDLIRILEDVTQGYASVWLVFSPGLGLSLVLVLGNV